jgi:phage head maturation protease
MNRERRTILGKVETRALTDVEKSAGYIGALVGVIPINSDSGVLRDRRLNNGQPFVERIAPKAFADAADVVAIAGHTDDPLAAFARQGANLTISEGEKEIRWEALLPDTTAARDLAQLGAKGILRGTSFEFDLGAEDKWEKRSDGTAVRTVTKGQLRAVNPVLWPAYDDSALTVSMRSRARRGIYASAETYAYNLTCDAAYALEALCDEIESLGNALDYLRCTQTPGTSSSGALADYARGEVTESAESIAELTAWLAANGAEVNPDLLERATKAQTEAQAKLSSFNSQLSTSPDADWEQRRREAIALAPELIAQK